MKRIIFAVIAVVALGWANTSQAQDCDAIVGPFYTLNGIDPNDYPVEKGEMYCLISQNAFYITTQVPNGSYVFDLRDLSSTLTGEKIASNFEVDLNTLSYWAYNFEAFRPYSDPHKPGVTIYFRIGKKSDHRFLAVRPYGEAMARALHPEEFKD